MSQLKTNSITHVDNTGDPNITLYADGSTSIRGFQGAAVNPNLLDNSSFRTNQRDLWIGETGQGFLCDRWSCGNRDGWSIQRGNASHSSEGQAPFGAYAVKVGNPAIWETGVELQNNASDQNPEFVNPVAYAGCKFVLSVWLHRPASNIDQLQGFVEFRSETNISEQNTVFFNTNMPRTTDSLTINGKVWWRYEQTIEITSNPTDVQKVLYVGFNLASDDLMACPKLERGSVYTLWQPEDLQTEELRCQRYFYKWAGRAYAHGVQTNSNQDNVSKYVTIFFPTGMAHTPAVTTIAANPGSLGSTSRWATVYSEMSPNNTANFVSGVEASAEMTDFVTWSNEV